MGSWVIKKESRGRLCFRDGPKCFVRGTSVSVKERLWGRSGFCQYRAKRRGCKGGGRGGGRNDGRLPGVVASGRCVWLSLRCSWGFQGQFCLCCDRSDSRGRGARVKEARWRGRALWSRRGSLSDAGLAGSGRSCSRLIINPGERPLQLKPCASLTQRLGPVGLEQKEVEGRWAVRAVSEGSDRCSVKPASHSASKSSCGTSSDDMEMGLGQAVWTRKGGRREAVGGRR